MKPYPEYKDSGIEWLGKIPKHWKTIRIAYIGRFLKGGGITRSDLTNEGLPVILYGDIYTQYEIKVKKFIRRTSVSVAQQSKKIFEDDLLMTGSGETVEDIGKCIVYTGSEQAYAGGDVIILRPENINSIYVSYVLNSDLLNNEKAKLARGGIIVHIYISQLRNLSIPIPPNIEQDKIANFLDHKTQQIDDLIAKKERLIELLKEERTAIINQAVTKGLPTEERKKVGLDPDVPMKDSGIEWLGEIPEHWDIKKLKYLTNSVLTGSTPPSNKSEYYENPNLNWFTPVDFNHNINLSVSKRKINTKALEDGVAKLFPANSVLIVGIGATLGKIGVLKVDSSSNQQINAIIFNDNFNYLYGAYYLKSKETIIKNLSNAATLAILNQTNTKNILVTNPPYEEQNAIVEFIIETEERIKITINKIKKEINLLLEYKSSLINEAVTGKIDVREEKINFTI